MNIRDLIKEYIEKRDKYVDVKKTVSKLENELAILISEPKVSNPESEPGASGDGSSKLLKKVDKKSLIDSKLEDNRKLLDMYEISYNKIKNDIIDTFKEFEEDKNSCGKEKNLFYVFYYRRFKKYILTFERIAEILNITTEWVKKIDKELDKLK